MNFQISSAAAGILQVTLSEQAKAYFTIDEGTMVIKRKHETVSIPEGIYIVTVIDHQIEPPHVYRISLVVNDSYRKFPEKDQEWLKPYIKSISVLGLLTVKWNESMVLPGNITDWT